MSEPAVIPRLVVADADRAIQFYVHALGAELLERFDDRGVVVHAGLEVAGHVFSLTEEDRAHGNDAPGSLGGTPVLLQVIVDDADALGERLREAGAEVVIPVADRFYGKREGRFRDPFGHLWIVSQVIEELLPEEIRRRLAEQQGEG